MPIYIDVHAKSRRFIVTWCMLK